MSKRTGMCPRCRGPHSGNHAAYCIQCWRDYQHEHRNGLIGAPETRVCVVCGKLFAPKQNDRSRRTKSCSVACNIKRQNDARTPEQIRSWRLRTNHGISLSEYNEILIAQRGVCAICGQPPTSRDRGVLHVDHCHNSGRLRGLLCSDCNRGIGQLKDDPEVLRNAADYLESSRLVKHPTER